MNASHFALGMMPRVEFENLRAEISDCRYRAAKLWRRATPRPAYALALEALTYGAPERPERDGWIDLGAEETRS